MASSEMRAVGIAGKFAYGFEKHGGSLEMLNWLADDSELMRQVVEVADQRLLVRGMEGTVKWVDGLTINSGNSIPHDSLVVEVKGDLSSINPKYDGHAVSQTSLVSYVLRKPATRSQVAREMLRLKLCKEISIGDFWGALIGFRTSPLSKLLNWSGGVNEFCLPYRASFGLQYKTIHAIYVNWKGWKIVIPDDLQPDGSFEEGTHFIVGGG